MGKRKEQELRELEAARNAKILELHLSEVEGQIMGKRKPSTGTTTKVIA
jgi:hypothetical protein